LLNILIYAERKESAMSPPMFHDWVWQAISFQTRLASARFDLAETSYRFLLS
jgi:hypothetical protein